MECTVRWTGLDGMSFLAETGSGHAALMDGAVEGGGHNLAPRPMELVLAGTGGCTAYDVVLIFTVRGRALKPNLVERAIKLSHDKYCSASAMLAKTATITMDWEVLED